MFLTRLYYRVKPLLPWSFRMRLRRWFARRKLRQVSQVWPVYPGSEKPPTGWHGWPDGKQFAFVLTHDVEGEEGIKKVRKLAELEMSLGFKSSFNLVPESPKGVPGDLRHWLTSNGFEVGIHDLRHDGSLFRSREDFSRGAVRINEHLRDWNADGFRSAFMLHNLDWIHDLNIQYDCSTFDTDPFEPQPHGQHTIFPFWVPRPGNGQHSNKSNGFEPGTGYVELPYTLAQDSTLFLVLREQTPQIWLQKLDWVAKHGGMAMVTVHPDYVQFEGEEPSARTYPVQHYVDLLRHVQERYEGRYYPALPGEIATYWKEQAIESNEKKTSARSERPTEHGLAYMAIFQWVIGLC